MTIRGIEHIFWEYQVLSSLIEIVAKISLSFELNMYIIHFQKHVYKWEIST